ncbi:MAG: hypothetical protein V1897_12425, partial [Pseudomonadota bacterium]
MVTHQKISSNDSDKRKLYCLPIVHTETDMGALGPVIRDSYLKKMGLQAWKRKKLSIERYWNELGIAINKLNLPYPNTKIYQDGLPVSEDGKEI